MLPGCFLGLSLSSSSNQVKVIHVQNINTSGHLAIWVLTIEVLLDLITCGCWCHHWWHKAASSAVLFSTNTKAAVLSLALQMPFPTHSARGQGRINMWLWWFIASTMHFNAHPFTVRPKRHIRFGTT